MSTILDQVRPIQGHKLSTATVSSTTSSTASVTILAANAERSGFVVVNDSTATLYLKFGSTASSSSYTYKLLAGDAVESMVTPYTGIVTGIWSAVNGNAVATELTA
jgi:CYTH domain-containing protein